MKAILLAAVAFASVPAMADTIIDQRYIATVSFADGTTANTGLTDGQMVLGEFMLDVTTNTILSASLAGFNAPTTASAQSTSALTPGLGSAVYALGTYASSNPGVLNDSVTVTLNALNIQNGGFIPAFAAGSTPGSVLNYQLGNVDTSGASNGTGSTAVFLMQDANGNTTEVYAYISLIPEPASMALFGAALAGLAGIRRRA